MAFSHDDASAFPAVDARVHASITQHFAWIAEKDVVSNAERIRHALSALPLALPERGHGLDDTFRLIEDKLLPALAEGQSGPRYLGLVTGGVLPSAALADNLVTAFDANVQVHNIEETICTTLEPITLRMVAELLGLPDTFASNSFTTGATASNILGLAVGRQHVIERVKHRQGVESYSVANDGFGGVDVDVFVATAHASVAKACSLVGIGRKRVHNLTHAYSLASFDLDELEADLKRNVGKTGSIVVTSFGEVNTGAITADHARLRELCDQYDAWLHIDAAFGGFAVLHPDFAHLRADLALADSITLDGHKWLNVPYDCGLFYSRSSTNKLYEVLGPGDNAPAYLTPSTSTASHVASKGEDVLDPYRSIPSPLFTSIENSKRFRALPVYASLVSLGREGYEELVRRNITFARQVEAFLRSSPSYEVLTPPSSSRAQDWPDSVPGETFWTMNIVLFRPSASAPSRYADGQDDVGVTRLKEDINASKRMYVTPTVCKGRRAIRLAVSNWRTTLDTDFEIVKDVLEGVMREAALASKQ